MAEEYAVCRRCDGTGLNWDEDEVCDACDGDGEIQLISGPDARQLDDWDTDGGNGRFRKTTTDD